MSAISIVSRRVGYGILSAIVMSVATIFMTCFEMPVRAGYNDPDVSITGPSAIMVGQTVTFHYTVSDGGEELAEGEFQFTGSAAGANQMADGGSVSVTVTRYPAHGGRFDEDVDVEIKAYVDVVELVSAESSRSFALIDRPVTLTAVTNPASYASQVQWAAVGNSTVSGAGAQANGYASSAENAKFEAVLIIDGAWSYKTANFLGVKVEMVALPGGIFTDYVGTEDANPAQKAVIGNPPGSLTFVPSSPLVTQVIADVNCIDVTGYYLVAQSLGGLITLLPGIGWYNVWTSTATWNYVSSFNGGTANPPEAEAYAGGTMFSVVNTKKDDLVFVLVGPFTGVQFVPNQTYSASSTAIVRAEVGGPLGTLGNILSAKAQATHVGGFIFPGTVVDVN